MKKLFALSVATLTLSVGCTEGLKPLARTVDDIARSLCSKYHEEAYGISLDEAAKLYCHTREAYAPWIDAALAGVTAGASAKAGVEKCDEPATPAVE
jgi:hypothetical protein